MIRRGPFFVGQILQIRQRVEQQWPMIDAVLGEKREHVPMKPQYTAVRRGLRRGAPVGDRLELDVGADNHFGEIEQPFVG